MGLLGSAIGGIAGGALGQGLGQKYGGNIGGQAGKDIGRIAGGALGSLLPFSRGGKVKKTGPALLHKGEMVIPAKHINKIPASLKKQMKKEGARNM